jgi:DNA-binding transcriptional regulator YhcF (GntR family)
MTLSKSEQIEQKILNDIYAGKYTDKLPSEKDMAKYYCTTPVTAAKILNRLKDKNIVRRVAGRGTFINHDALQRKIRMYLPFEKEMLEEIKLELKKLFPENVFEFINQRGMTFEELSEKTDITYMTSYFPDSYDKFFAPLPESTVNELLDDGKFYSGAVLAHNNNWSFYGMPYCVSPCIVIYNKELLDKYLPGSRQSITTEDLLELNSRLKKEKLALFDYNNFQKGTVLDCIFSQIDEAEINRRDIKNVSWETIKKGCDLFHDIYNDSIEKNASFAKGEAIFSRTCRQSFCKRHVDLDFSWDVLPVSLGPTRLSVLASEALFVQSKASNKEKLFDICRAFLSQGIQSIIGKHKYGIPVLKSAALASMDSRKIRDDIYFNEMNNVVFKYELFEKPLMNSFILDIGELFEMNIPFSNFISRVENLYRLNEQNLKTKDQFANENYF